DAPQPLEVLRHLAEQREQAYLQADDVIVPITVMLKHLRLRLLDSSTHPATLVYSSKLLGPSALQAKMIGFTSRDFGTVPSKRCLDLPASAAGKVPDLVTEP